MSQSRKKVIEDAFKSLSLKANGKLTLDDIAKNYDVSRHPEVVSSKRTMEEVYMEYMTNWGIEDPGYLVSVEKFMEYYSDISSCIRDDEGFIQLVKCEWKL